MFYSIYLVFFPAFFLFYPHISARFKKKIFPFGILCRFDRALYIFDDGNMKKDAKKFVKFLLNPQVLIIK